jgi:RNA polymerase sigma-70 factor (sigma-E family)
LHREAVRCGENCRYRWRGRSIIVGVGNFSTGEAMLASPLVVVPGPAAGVAVPAALPPAAAAGWAAGQAVTEIYRDHYRSLVRMATLLIRDSATAEEVVQDCFVSMHLAWPRLRDDDKALAYLRRSVLNRARSVLRRRQIADRHPPKPEPDAPSAEHGAIARLERTAVIAALRLLPVRQREVLVLRYYLDLPESQVAAAMGITRGAVKAHTSRAMAAMRNALAAEA